MGFFKSADSPAPRPQLQYTAAETTDSVTKHYQGKRVVCPYDDALVKVEEIVVLGSSKTVLVECPLCGRSGQKELP